MREAKKELGKAFLNLANMLFVLYLLGYYLKKENINFFVLFLLIYAIISFYVAGFYLIKEASDE